MFSYILKLSVVNYRFSEERVVGSRLLVVGKEVSDEPMLSCWL